jgi:hypothetical protein
MDLSRFMFLADRLSRESVDPLLTEAVTGLRTDWRDADPGKHAATWFFVRAYLLEDHSRGGQLTVLKRPLDVERFWVDQLVDDRAPARRGRSPIGEFKDVRRVMCDSHGSAAWVVGKYDQTFDGPDGDIWQVDLYLLCPSCPKLHHLASRSEGCRFM